MMGPARPRYQAGDTSNLKGIQVGANSRDGSPVRAVLQALGSAGLYRTDRLGTVELVETG